MSAFLWYSIFFRCTCIYLIKSQPLWFCNYTKSYHDFGFILSNHAALNWSHILRPACYKDLWEDSWHESVNKHPETHCSLISAFTFACLIFLLGFCLLIIPLMHVFCICIWPWLRYEFARKVLKHERLPVCSRHSHLWALSSDVCFYTISLSLPWLVSSRTRFQTVSESTVFLLDIRPVWLLDVGMCMEYLHGTRSNESLFFSSKRFNICVQNWKN